MTEAVPHGARGALAEYELETGCLVVGAAGMALVDTLLDERPGTSLLRADRPQRSGGHVLAQLTDFPRGL